MGDTYGGYYGLDVVTPPPRPQTFLCERGNLKKNPKPIASIYPPPPPLPSRIGKNFTLGLVYKTTVGYVVPLLNIYLLCDEVLLP